MYGDEEVVRLVLLTAGHEVEPGDRNGAVLVDADLSILGAPPERYARYAADVRAEYAHVDDDGVAGRTLSRPAPASSTGPGSYVTDRVPRPASTPPPAGTWRGELAALGGGEPQP